MKEYVKKVITKISPYILLLLIIAGALYAEFYFTRAYFVKAFPQAEVQDFATVLQEQRNAMSLE